MSSVYDRIAASVPVNAQASMSSARGVEWTPSVEIRDYLSDIPQMRSVQNLCSENASFVDFTGREIGRLTVIGLAKCKGHDGKARWVLRCKCGGYCLRSARSLKIGLRDGSSFVSMCGMCSYQQQIRAQTLKGMRNDWMAEDRQ